MIGKVNGNAFICAAGHTACSKRTHWKVDQMSCVKTADFEFIHMVLAKLLRKWRCDGDMRLFLYKRFFGSSFAVEEYRWWQLLGWKKFYFHREIFSYAKSVAMVLCKIIKNRCLYKIWLIKMIHFSWKLLLCAFSWKHNRDRWGTVGWTISPLIICQCDWIVIFLQWIKEVS